MNWFCIRELGSGYVYRRRHQKGSAPEAMADVTQRMSAAAWRLAMSAGSSRMTGSGDLKSIAPFDGRPVAVRRAKYRNKRVTAPDGQKYDSTKEFKHHQALILARLATSEKERVVSIQRQQSYLLVPASPEERAVRYFADFVVTFADGRIEVQDTKSPPTRALPAYVIKRKLMRSVHGIRIIEL